MKSTKLKSAVITLIIAMFTIVSSQAQVNNRLPRKEIIGAMNNALQDTTGATIKPFVCKSKTKAITIEVTNPSVPVERPYIITADSLGVTLEIFRGEEHVFNEYYPYRGCNFAKIKAKVNSAKLKKVKTHGESIDGGNTTVLSFLTSKGKYFSLSDISGMMNYEGDFDGVITEITRQIPNFQAIICKDYKRPIALKDGEVRLDKSAITLRALSEVSNVLSIGNIKDLTSINVDSVSYSLNLTWKESDNRSFKLIPAKQYKPKKGNATFWGTSYDEIVKNGIIPTSINTSDGVVKVTFTFTPENEKVYILLDTHNKTAYPFKVTLSSQENEADR